MMKSPVIFALATAATAATIGDYVPECAVSCLEDAIKSATPCAVDDLNCICIADNYRATYTAGGACVIQACGTDAAVGDVLPGAQHMCEVVLSSTYEGDSSTTAPADGTATSPPIISASTTGDTFSIQTDTAAPTSGVSAATGSANANSTSAAPAATSSVAAGGSDNLQANFCFIGSFVLAVLAWL